MQIHSLADWKGLNWEQTILLPYTVIFAIMQMNKAKVLYTRRLREVMKQEAENESRKKRR